MKVVGRQRFRKPDLPAWFGLSGPGDVPHVGYAEFRDALLRLGPLAGQGDPVACRDLGVLLGFDPGPWTWEVLSREAANRGAEFGLSNLGTVLDHQGRCLEAIPVYEQAYGDGDPDVAYSLACMYALKGDYSRAIEWLDRSTEEVYTPVAKADFLRKLGDEVGRRAVLEEAKTTSWHAAVDLVLERYEPFDPHAAIKLLESFDAWNLPGMLVPLANLYERIGDDDTAVIVLKRAVELGDIHAVHNLGVSYCDLGKRKKGLRLVRQAASAGDDLAVNYLAKVERKRERKASGREQAGPDLKQGSASGRRQGGSSVSGGGG
jgi:TPR repeat protein